MGFQKPRKRRDPMIRHAQLIVTTARLIDEDDSASRIALYHAEGGIPLLWIFLFGARNVWMPGDDLKARGGAVGMREIYETPTEVALVRLEHAEGALRGDPHIWPWYSALELLRRKLALQPKNGFVLLQSQWSSTPGKELEETWRSAPALVENFVNLVGSGDSARAATVLDRVEPFCTFTPRGDESDRKAFQKAKLYKDQDPAVRLALMMLGEPPGRGRAVMEQAARKDIDPLLREHLAGEGRRYAPTAAVVAEGAADAGGPAKGGVLARLTGLFGKR